MHQKTFLRWLFFFTLLAGIFNPASGARAVLLPAAPAQSDEVTAYDLIVAMNTLRMANGLPALVEDSIINAVAQSTAETMAADQMSWHIGDVSGRLATAGYGGGAKVWATENFAVGGHHSIDTIMVVWADPSHMIPAVNPAYCHVGAGTAKASNGMTYYVLQAAYIAGKSCGDYTPSEGGATTQPGGGSTGGVPQLIVPVKVATPDVDGKVFHVVQAGQSLWAIAVTYKITIRDLEIWNNISKDAKLRVGQRLFVPGDNTEGYATPTPVGMILPSTPDSDGKIIHTVQSHQTLITISQAYKVNLETVLSLNGLQADWPLQIGQKLLISPGFVTPSPTPRPLSPVEKLTPASDGKYYHTVRSGETLSWIADLYEVQVIELMTWNGLSMSSIIVPEQKLVLQVTPPATITPTPRPPTASPSATQAPPTPTLTRKPTEAASSPTSNAGLPTPGGGIQIGWLVFAGLAAGGMLLAVLYSRKKS